MCEAGLAEVFRGQQTRLQHGLPLGSYLLKPVQRILKYHLLLQVRIITASMFGVFEFPEPFSSLVALDSIYMKRCRSVKAGNMIQIRDWPRPDLI